MKAVHRARNKHAHAAAIEVPPNLAPHPRAREMARKPQGRATCLSEAEIRTRLWQAQRHVVIPATAIHANVPLQNDPLYPRPGCQYRYENALNAPRLDAKHMKTFVDDTLFLFEQGLLRNMARVGAIKNRALRELGDYPGTRRLAQALACACEAAEMRPGAWRNRHWAA